MNLLIEIKIQILSLPVDMMDSKLLLHVYMSVVLEKLHDVFYRILGLGLISELYVFIVIYDVEYKCLLAWVVKLSFHCCGLDFLHSL